MLSLLIRQVVAQTEKELWQIQQETNQRARNTEEYVVEYEKLRLTQAGHYRLAESVERISKYDAKASYDILSYNVDGSMRAM